MTTNFIKNESYSNQRGISESVTCPINNAWQIGQTRQYIDSISLSIDFTAETWDLPTSTYIQTEYAYGTIFIATKSLTLSEIGVRYEGVPNGSDISFILYKKRYRTQDGAMGSVPLYFEELPEGERPNPTQRSSLITLSSGVIGYNAPTRIFRVLSENTGLSVGDKGNSLERYDFLEFAPYVASPPSLAEVTAFKNMFSITLTLTLVST